MLQPGQPSDPTHAPQRLSSLNGNGDSPLEECAISPLSPSDGKAAPSSATKCWVCLPNECRGVKARGAKRCEGEGSKGIDCSECFLLHPVWSRPIPTEVMLQI